MKQKQQKHRWKSTSTHTLTGIVYRYEMQQIVGIIPVITVQCVEFSQDWLTLAHYYWISQFVFSLFLLLPLLLLLLLLLWCLRHRKTWEQQRKANKQLLRLWVNCVKAINFPCISQLAITIFFVVCSFLHRKLNCTQASGEKSLWSKFSWHKTIVFFHAFGVFFLSRWLTVILYQVNTDCRIKLNGFQCRCVHNNNWKWM